MRYQMNPTQNWGPASKARPAPKVVPAAEAEPDAGVLPPPGSESLVDMGLQPVGVVPQEADANGIEAGELAVAEEAVERTSTGGKRSAEDEQERQPAKKRREAAEVDEEAAMNSM